MLIALRGLLSAEPLPGEEADAEAPAGGRPAAASARCSRFGVPALDARLRGGGCLLDPAAAAPGRGRARLPRSHELRQHARRWSTAEDVLFLGRDNFVSWELIGSEVYAPIINHYDIEEVPVALPGDPDQRQVRLGQRAAPSTPCY